MIRFYSTKIAIKKIAHQCLLHSVFSSYGTMKNWFWDVDNIKNIIVYFNKQRYPIAALLVLKEHNTSYNCNCGIFVKQEYRRLGIGRKIIDKAKRMNIELSPWTGSMSAKSFYSNTLK